VECLLLGKKYLKWFCPKSREVQFYSTSVRQRGGENSSTYDLDKTFVCKILGCVFVSLLNTVFTSTSILSHMLA